jgi:hypothetical protein
MEIKMSPELEKDLDTQGFVIKNDEIIKNDIIIRLKSNPLNKTKEWVYNGYHIKVPYPVVGYLTRLYGENWKDET